MPDPIDDGRWRESALARMSDAFVTNRGLLPMYILMATAHRYAIDSHRAIARDRGSGPQRRCVQRARVHTRAVPQDVREQSGVAGRDACLRPASPAAAARRQGINRNPDDGYQAALADEPVDACADHPEDATEAKRLAGGA